MNRTLERQETEAGGRKDRSQKSDVRVDNHKPRTITHELLRGQIRRLPQRSIKNMISLRYDGIHIDMNFMG